MTTQPNEGPQGEVGPAGPQGRTGKGGPQGEVGEGGPQGRRGRGGRTGGVLIGVLVVQIIVVGALGIVGAKAIDRSDNATAALAASVDEDVVATCERGNLSRENINDLNRAVVAVVDAGRASNETKRAILTAVEGSALALIAAADASTPGPLPPESQAAADAFTGATSELANEARAQIALADDLLTHAAGLLEDALLPIRDCPRVLDDPDATIPATTVVP